MYSALCFSFAVMGNRKTLPSMETERETYVKARLVKRVSGTCLCAAGTDPVLRK